MMKGEDKERAEQSCEKTEKSDKSSLHLKDSAYGSFGKSAFGSMDPKVPLSEILDCHHFISKRSHNTPTSAPSGGSSSINSHTSFKIKSNLGKIKEENRRYGEQDYRDCKAAKIVTLSQVLGYVDPFRKSHCATHEGQDKGKNFKTLVANLTKVCQGSKQEETNSSLSQKPLKSESQSKAKKNLNSEIGKNLHSDSFCVAVSMNTGMVVHTTPILTSVLGYPKDMWIGRNFTDFVHPMDKEFFISQVSKNINLIMEKSLNVNIENMSKNFYCRIRQYSSLKCGFAVKELKKKFKPFKICVSFSTGEPWKPHGRDESEGSGLHLIVTAVPVTPRFTTPDMEVNLNKPLGEFTTKHNARSSWLSVDEDSVPLLGYFPHELQGRDIFDIIHPNDWNDVKDSFELMICSKNSISKPYRIRTRNLDYVTVISSWKPFINPWNQQLEFIFGTHKIVKGPKSTNIFSESSHAEVQEKTLQDKAELKEKTKMILQNYVRKKQIFKKAHDSSVENKRKSQLSNFMGLLLKEVANGQSFEPMRSDAGVIIGKMSLYQSDSSESSPSYNQLTYNENLTRFFNSQPKTLSEKDVLSTGVYSSSSSYEDNPLNGGAVKEQKKLKGSGWNTGEDSRSQGTQHQQTESGSGEMGLSAGQAGECARSCTSSSSGSRKAGHSQHTLTRNLLALHNREMEKQMVLNFKQAKRVETFGLQREKNKNKGTGSDPKNNQVSAIQKSEEGKIYEINDSKVYPDDSVEMEQGNMRKILSTSQRQAPQLCLPPGANAQSSSGENISQNYLQVRYISTQILMVLMGLFI